MSAAFVIVALACYFLPLIIATARNTEKHAGLILFNVLLGWTVIGWIIALIWACSAETKQQALYRKLAEEQLARGGALPSPQYSPVQPSAPHGAGYLAGSLIRRARRDPEPPPSIKPQRPLDRLIDKRLSEND